MKSALVSQVSVHFAIQSNSFDRTCQQFFTIDVVEVHRNQSNLPQVTSVCRGKSSDRFEGFADQPVVRPLSLTIPFEPGKINKLALIMEANSPQNGLRQPSGPNQLQDVEDQLSILLGKKGYTLVSRSEMQTLLKEKQFQASGLTEENITVFGKMLNVPIVLVVRITDSSAPTSMRNQSMTTAAVGARLVSVETGEVLWCRTYIESQKTASKLDQSQVLTKVTKKVGDLFPSRE